MSDQQAPPQGRPTLPDGTVEEDPLVATNELIRAIRLCATKASSDDSAAECKDYAAAALSLAQAIITLDPTRLQGGDTPQARQDATPNRPPTTDGDRDGQIGA